MIGKVATCFTRSLNAQESRNNKKSSLVEQLLLVENMKSNGTTLEQLLSNFLI